MHGHALERLGHQIVSRRVTLGYRNRTDFANSLQFTVRTLSDIENGVRKGNNCLVIPLTGQSIDGGPERSCAGYKR